jgi:hypothetical protein
VTRPVVAAGSLAGTFLGTGNKSTVHRKPEVWISLCQANLSNPFQLIAMKLTRNPIFPSRFAVWSPSRRLQTGAAEPQEADQ